MLSLNAAGFSPSWKTAIFAHLVWIVPIVTLGISIRFFGYDPAQEEAARDLGANSWQVVRERELAARPMARHLFRGTVRVPSVLVKSAPVDLHFGTGHPASSVAVHQDRHELLSSGAIGRRDRNTGLRGAGCVACFNHVRGAPGSG